MTPKKHFWYAVVIFWGCLALGDDHVTGNPQVSCSIVPFDCIDECEALNACLSIPGNEPFFDCGAEYGALEGCRVSPPPRRRVIIVIPVCPAGQHFNEGECQADHECGADEIGGGETPCEKCGEGEAPNEDKTACVECKHGEHPLKSGTCACDSMSVDKLAAEQLKHIHKDPWEHFERYYCAGGLNPSVGFRTYSTNGQQDVCSLDVTPGVMSWISSSIAVGHSHPYFDPAADYSGANRVQCGVDRNGEPTYIDSGSTARFFNMVAGKMFSPSDKQWSVPTYLVVPERDEVKVYRPDEGSEETIWKK